MSRVLSDFDVLACASRAPCHVDFRLLVFQFHSSASDPLKLRRADTAGLSSDPSGMEADCTTAAVDARREAGAGAGNQSPIGGLVSAKSLRS